MSKPSNKPQRKSTPKRLAVSWFKACRTEDALEVIRTNPLAYVLAAVIAYRARWKTEGFFRYNLQPGEALLGDYESYGMTEGQYRNAKKNLKEWGFATFKTTNRGTVGKLIDSRLFSVTENKNDGQNATPTTDGTTPQRRTNDGRTTTNLEGIDGGTPSIESKKDGNNAPIVAGSADAEAQQASLGASVEGDASCLHKF